MKRLLWVVVLLAAAAIGFGLGQTLQVGQAARQYADLKSRFNTTVAQYQHDLSSLAAEREALSGQLVVEQTTRHSLEQSLQAAQQDLAQARERLAFYDQLLPPGPAGSVAIRAFEVERQGGALAYRVLLMRNGTPGSSFNGHMEFVANGVRAGKAVKINLEPAQAAKPANASATSPLQIQFDQFQRAEGLLAVPRDVRLKSVTLNIVEGATVRASRSAGLATP